MKDFDEMQARQKKRRDNDLAVKQGAKPSDQMLRDEKSEYARLVRTHQREEADMLKRQRSEMNEALAKTGVAP